MIPAAVQTVTAAAAAAAAATTAAGGESIAGIEAAVGDTAAPTDMSFLAVLGTELVCSC